MSTEQNGQAGQPEKKKISLQEAIKQKLASKQSEQAQQKNFGHAATGTKKLKSQQSKKISNQRRKMGV